MPGLRHLIIVLPGIGGSVLERPAQNGQPAAVVWDAGIGDILDLVRQPANLSLTEYPRLRPVGLVRSRRLLPGWTVVHGYDRLIERLSRMPGVHVDSGHPEERNPAADVVLFPYDFRHSIVQAAERLAAEVASRLGDLTAAARSRRVILVAHSMGGLVARYWLGPLGGWKVCRALITLGTPHRGAPKALRWFVDGVRVGPVTIDGPTQLFREWPSVAELLPRYPVIWDEVAGQARYPHELPIEWVATAAKQAYDLHQEIERESDTIPRSGPHLVPRMGWSHHTLSAARWDGRTLQVTTERPTWLDLGGWRDDHGDGTVPAFSAMPTEMDGDSPGGLRVRQRHGPLGSARFIVDLIQQYERWTPLTPVRAGATHAAAIGLDLNDTYAAGGTVPVRAAIRGVTEDVSGVAVWATLRRSGQPAVLANVRLDHDETGEVFSGVLAVPDPGMYDVTVTARQVPGVGDLSTLDSFAAVDW